MYPPIFETCAANSEVLNHLGESPVRLFPFGEAPEDVAKPYAVWQRTSGTPENYLDKVPDIDSFTTQIDVYGTSGSTVRDAAVALRDAIEPVAHVVSWLGESRDPDTHHYRFTFLVDWWTERT